MTRILITLALSIYNNVANLWPPFNRWAYVPANISATALLAVLSVGALGLTSAELGLDELTIGDASLGLAVGLAFAGSLLVVRRTAWGARLIADRRVAGLRGRMLAYQTLVRVPLGTALLEEFAFRGVLFAAWRSEGTFIAALISSVVFGLWHVAPAAIMVRTNDPVASGGDVARRIVGTVVLMTLIGLGLVWLRLETGSLLAPLTMHAGVNSLATWIGARTARGRGLLPSEVDR